MTGGVLPRGSGPHLAVAGGVDMEPEPERH